MAKKFPAQLFKKSGKTSAPVAGLTAKKANPFGKKAATPFGKPSGTTAKGALPGATKKSTPKNTSGFTGTPSQMFPAKSSAPHKHTPVTSRKPAHVGRTVAAHARTKPTPPSVTSAQMHKAGQKRQKHA